MTVGAGQPYSSVRFYMYNTFVWCLNSLIISFWIVAKCQSKLIRNVLLIPMPINVSYCWSMLINTLGSIPGFWSALICIGQSSRECCLIWHCMGINGVQVYRVGIYSVNWLLARILGCCISEAIHPIFTGFSPLILEFRNWEIQFLLSKPKEENPTSVSSHLVIIVAPGRVSSRSRTTPAPYRKTYFSYFSSALSKQLAIPSQTE